MEQGLHAEDAGTLPRLSWALVMGHTWTSLTGKGLAQVLPSLGGTRETQRRADRVLGTRPVESLLLLSQKTLAGSRWWI